MNIVIIGTGYVGLVTGVGLASLGNTVDFIDLDENKIEDLSDKKITFYEPGLEEYFNDEQTFKRMSFSSDYRSIKWDNIDIVFVCVQTPNNIETNSVDTNFLESAIKEINNVNNSELVITVKSTIPPYEIEKVCEKVGMDSSKLTFNPEFLREGSAVEDFFKPDRIVLGGTDSEKLSKLKELYSGFECEIIITDSISSQLIKYLANTYLPLRLSFVNEATRLIDYSGGNLDDVLKGVGLDNRIGQHYFRPSPSWGGSCFPKDLVEVNNFYDNDKLNLPIISNILNSNDIHANWTSDNIKELYESKELDGVVLIGAAFKEDTDDLRNSPTTEVLKILKSSIENVIVFDEIINNENIVKFDYLESLNTPHLFVLMYPVNESTLDRLNKIIEDSNSVTYIPWSL
ncbi:nucleotide sugar dehydrogenase [Acidimicrobiaceae bacterium]|nr:nucleotide sugar dehydrogenase [Acidimicrobiaceae bacterium]